MKLGTIALVDIPHTQKIQDRSEKAPMVTMPVHKECSAALEYDLKSESWNLFIGDCNKLKSSPFFL